tara:strand:+ start:99 stop:587 length:489 start_codon:yes stop_codon:yes gene_type:complete
MSIFLGLGSNIGDKANNLMKVISSLKNVPNLAIIKRSKIYETSPLENENQDYFLNQVIMIKFDGNPIDLFNITKSIEKQMGRIRNNIRYQPRVIDIDILSFNDEIINNDDLILPHPKIKFRKFVLKPWTDIASDYILPNSKMTIKEHLDKISHLEDEIREYS